jgi:hypothetical protein
LPYEDFDQGVIGYAILDISAYRDLPILIVNKRHLFYGKACVPENIHNDQNCLKTIITTLPM